jgi:hypothetical protein
MRTNSTVPAADEAATDGRRRSRRSLWAPILVNLLLGVPAIAPLYSAQWLLTKYLPMDCRSSADFETATNCHYPTLDDAIAYQLLLVVSGVLVLVMVAMADILAPLARGRSMRPWLGSTVLLLFPYAALWALYLSGAGLGG